MASAPDLYSVIPPPPVLAPYVERFLYADINHSVDYKIRPFPTGRCFIGFVFRDSISSQRADQWTSVTGFHFCGQVGKDDINVHYRGEVGHIMAELKPTAMLRLFRIPAVEITGLSTDIRDFLPQRAVNHMLDYFRAAPDRASRIAAFSQLLLGQLSAESDRGSLVADVADHIDASHGRVRVADLAEHFDVSKRTLTRKFTEIVGLTPKRYATVARLNNSIRLLSTKAFDNLAEIAATAGYYDEAHMSHDFTRHFGTSPARFIETQNAIIMSYAEQNAGLSER